jgi:hypothetical protein
MNGVLKNLVTLLRGQTYESWELKKQKKGKPKL